MLLAKSMVVSRHSGGVGLECEWGIWILGQEGPTVGNMTAGSYSWVSLLLQGIPQDKVTTFPCHPALPSSSGSTLTFLMDFQERDTPSVTESTQSSKPSSTQQV